MSHAEVYLSLQVQFLTALQTKDLVKAFDISQDIEKRWPGHPNVALFREVIEKKAKELEDNKMKKTQREEEEEESDEEEEESSEDVDEETMKKDAAFEAEMNVKMEKWEAQLHTNDYDGMKAELEAVGLLKKQE